MGTFALAFAGQAIAAEGAPQAPQPGPGDPVNLYAPGVDVYASHANGEIHPWHAHGQVWLMAGEPGDSNVTVQVGEEGLLVVDTGTAGLAPKLLAQIQRLAQEHGKDQQAIRLVVNTNGQADHIGGNAVVSAAGSQLVSGEELPQQSVFGSKGAEVLAHQNVLMRLVAEAAAGTAYSSRALWPTDTEDFDVYNSYFNGEAVQLYHPHEASTDGQLMALFRQSDVIAAGDVVDMDTYPIIDVARGGSIDGELVALNKVIEMSVPAGHSEGGTVIIPGHGHLCDVSDVAQYKVMVTIIRNRVQFYKNQGKTLQQILALDPSSDYDQRWGATGGAWTTRDFITAVYKTLPTKGPVFFSMRTSTSVPTTGTRSGEKQF
jgi:glyoxylase-like metal-dependent hydrolase (beta-lactamase superfamily II)